MSAIGVGKLLTDIVIRRDREGTMALSDYLTGGEWDACFYASMGQHYTGNFGSSMGKTINHLLGKGYKFEGLDKDGNKDHQVCNGVNASKVCIFLGNPYGCDILDILENGRNFLKTHAPELVDETDAEWSKQIAEARTKS